MLNLNTALPTGLGSTLTGKLSGHATQDETASELKQAGKEFESVFLSMMLKEMRSTISEDGLFSGDKSDTLGGMFDMFMSQHLAGADALGMQGMIESFIQDTGADKPSDLPGATLMIDKKV